jgi:uncharacterized membrane protein (UPF0127 family)
MKKIHWQAVFLAAVIFLGAIFPFLIKEKIVTSDRLETEKAIKEMQIKNRKFFIEMVTTPEKRKKGLSGRKELCPNCAMLFVFKKPERVSFWMKDMLFDLDIIWIFNDEVVGIAENVSHERDSAKIVHSPVFVDKVLEVNAGMSGELGLKAGDKIEF